VNTLIEQATAFLKGKIAETPVEYSQDLSEIAGHPVFLKLECFQITGSFKLRGAFFYLSRLDERERKRGIAACSAGNHGLGLAYAAKKMGIPCTIFVPKNVDPAKASKIQKLGALLRKTDSIGYDDTLAWGMKEADAQGLPFVTAYNDEKIMAANGGTIGVEAVAQVPEASDFILPIGGGGLSAGFSWHVKSVKPHARIHVCQLAACPAFKLSLEQGKAVTYMPPVDTLAGGLEGGVGEKCFEILKTRVDSAALISEEELRTAMRWFLEHQQILIEPSASVAIAALLYGRLRLKGPALIVLTGRNVHYRSVKSSLCN